MYDLFSSPPVYIQTSKVKQQRGGGKGSFCCRSRAPYVQNLLACDELKSVPFLILGNKIDIPRAASEQELRDTLGLHQTTGKVCLLI